MPLPAKRTMRPSLRVATAIKLDIEKGVMKPGERLVVERLATTHKVAPMTVHKALWMLHRSGNTEPVGLPTGRRHWFVADRASTPRSP
ncbi:MULTISPECIES: GntR family transcriptional regulator [unclassified Streptomyces]|uniref:GntR family transcriptional regulator n=1 Tax=Streptomyces TaxID=1883 RepID=UPI00136CEDE9|nr:MULTISPECIES: GntR family transcriptional regulator [unclassified Streptomyces]MYV95302.1 GntR family transcriptional regulator [Streptomyces sp. SID1034]